MPHVTLKTLKNKSVCLFYRTGDQEAQIPLPWADEDLRYDPEKLGNYIKALHLEEPEPQDSTYNIGVGSHILLGIPHPHMDTLHEVADKEAFLLGHENKFEVKVGDKVMLTYKHSTRELPTPHPHLVLPEPLDNLCKILAVGLLQEEAVRATIQKLKPSSAVVHKDCEGTLRSLENVADGLKATTDRLEQRLAGLIVPFWYQQMDGEKWGAFEADLNEAEGFLKGWY